MKPSGHRKISQTLRAVIFSTLLLLQVFVVFSLDPGKKISQYVHQQWGVRKGLPHSSINAMTRTSDGYLWIATEEGLVSFDGLQFKTYDSNNTEGLSNDFITYLFEDDRHYLWVCTLGGGLARMDMQSKKMLPFSLPGNFAVNSVRALCQHRKDTFWVGTDDGLYYLDSRVNKLQSYQRAGVQIKSGVKVILKDIDSNLWLGTTNGLIHFKPQTGEIHSYTTQNGLPDNKITALCFDHQGGLWIGTFKGLVHLKENRLIPYTLSKPGQAVDNINALSRGEKNFDLWIGTEEGLKRLNYQQGTVDTFTTEDGLSHNDVRSFYYDFEGSLWVGTNEDLNRFKDGMFTAYATRGRGVYSRVWSLLEDSRGRIWAGEEDGLIQLNHHLGSFVPYTYAPGAPPSDWRVWSIAEDFDQRLWLGTVEGLKCLDTHTRRLIAYSKHQSQLSSGEVFALFIDSHGALWFGLEKKLYRLDFHSDTLTDYSQHGIPEETVRVIFEDSRNYMWFAVRGKGLICLNPAEGVLEVYDAKASKTPLSCNCVRSLYEDKYGYLWIATYGGGINRLNLKDNSIVHITYKDGLFNNRLHKVIEDNHGNFWFSSNKGIFRVSRRQLEDFCDGKLKDRKIQCISYNEENGMKSRECNGVSQPRGMKSRDGRLWFPCMKGVSVVDPRKIKTGNASPPIKIEAPYLWYKGDSHTSFVEGEMLQPGVQRLEIHYICLSLLDPQNVMYRHKLEGYDRSWSTRTFERKVAYTQLPPGEYTFHVEAFSNDAAWRKQKAALSFFIKPYFYQTFWFKILVGLFLIAFIFVAYKVWIRRIVKREETLEKLVDEHTRELIDRNEELETNFQFIRQINQINSVEPLLEVLLEVSMAFFPQSESGTFLLYHNQEKVFKPVVIKDSNFPTPMESPSLTYEEAINRYTVGSEKLGEGLYILREFEHIAASEKFEDFPIPKSMLVMTVAIENRLEGVLVLCNMKDSHAFDNSGIQRMLLFREHAVSGVCKARNYEQLESKVKERTGELLQANQELRVAKESAERAREMAENASRAKSEFLANMSHEIRTPMNAILGFTEILESEISGEQNKKYLQAISSSGKTLLSLINDILDLSKIEAGKMELEFEPTDPRIVLTEIQHIFSNKVKEKQLDFLLEVDPNIPEALLIDSLRLRQILFNLVGNAVKFTDSGYVKLGIALSPYIDTDEENTVEIIFSVSDTGFGIPKDRLDTIFDVFESKGERSGKYGGTGLGLAITKRLTEMMGGGIFVRSEVGIGSTFQVVLPGIPVAEGQKELGQWSSMDVDSILLKNATVLVVDDKDLNRQLIASYLVDQELQILEAANGAEAVQMTLQFHPDIILMDVKMPIMSGYEATTVIKEDPELKHIPIIYVTASVMMDQQEEAEQTGSDGFLTKPLNKLELFGQLIRFIPYTIKESNSDESEESRQKKNSPDTATISEKLKEKLPQLVSCLKDEYIPRWENINKTFMVDEMEDFSQEIETLGKQYNLDILDDWGQQLNKEVLSFDMKKITQTMTYFPSIIQQIEQLMEDQPGKQDIPVDSTDHSVNDNPSISSNPDRIGND